jgi:hypothetical protein
MYKSTQNAHVTESRVVLYRWHPWHGRLVYIVGAVARNEHALYRCVLELALELVRIPGAVHGSHSLKLRLDQGTWAGHHQLYVLNEQTETGDSDERGADDRNAHARLPRSRRAGVRNDLRPSQLRASLLTPPLGACAMRWRS